MLFVFIIGDYIIKIRNESFCAKPSVNIVFKIFRQLLLWRTINLGRPVIGLTSKCEAGIMFN
jgi:hypothetical protein